MDNQRLCTVGGRTRSITRFETNLDFCHSEQSEESENMTIIDSSVVTLLNDMSKKIAFTLAEVLITIGIIGVVAAMTIPNLITNWQIHKTVTQLVQTQSIISQAIRMAEEEYGEASTWGLTGFNDETATNIANKLKPFLKLAHDCGLLDTQGICVSNGPYVTLENKYPSYYGNSTGYPTYVMKLYNGAGIMVRPRNDEHNDNYLFSIYVDTNGSSKPNVWGRDLFSFTYETSKGLIAQGAKGSRDEYEEACKIPSNGYGCAYYVINFKNQDYLKK